jgi:hypothetical protein
MPTLMSAFTAGVKISHFLGQQLPDNLLSFRGENYDLFLAPIGEAYCLLVATKPTLINNTSKIAKAIQATSKAVVMSLDNLGISTRSRGTGSLKGAPAPKEKAKGKDAPAKSDAELEDLLKDAKEVKQTDADAFWESLATEVKPDLGSGDSLSYDQAVQLGLAPSDDKKK